MFGFGSKRKTEEDSSPANVEDQLVSQVDDADLDITQSQPFWTAILPVIACGAGLFSDGEYWCCLKSIEVTSLC